MVGCTFIGAYQQIPSCMTWIVLSGVKTCFLLSTCSRCQRHVDALLHVTMMKAMLTWRCHTRHIRHRVKACSQSDLTTQLLTLPRGEVTIK